MNTANLWFSLLQVTICSATSMFSKPPLFRGNRRLPNEHWKQLYSHDKWPELLISNKKTTQELLAISTKVFCKVSLWKGIVEGAEESSKGLWNMSPWFWSYLFLWTDFSEFDFPFKRGNTEPGCTHTLILTRSKSNQKGIDLPQRPRVARRWGRWGSGGGESKGAGKRRHKLQSSSRDSKRPSSPLSTAKWLSSPISYLPCKECKYVEEEKIWKHKIALWTSWNIHLGFRGLIPLSMLSIHGFWL